MIDEVLKKIGYYIERNDTLEEFISDMGTGGGTFICEGQTLQTSNWLDHRNGIVTVKDKGWAVILAKFKAKELWDRFHNGIKPPQQLTLFS